MAYTTIDKPTDYFNIVLYTGNGGTQSITGVGFAPNWVWGKSRSVTEGNAVHDTVRGARKNILTNTDAAEEDIASITAFGSDGFSLGSNAHLNKNNSSMVAWNWKAGTSFSNSAGANSATIASTGSVNTDAGFSIISYTGNGNDDDTAKIAHGLGVAANMIIVKCRNAAGGWQTSSTSLGFNNVLQLNETNAQASGTYAFGRTGVAPTSTVFTVSATSGGNHTNTNNNTYIAYCFAEKQGYSKFGSYTGNGNADGTFVYTGFKPAWVLIKWVGGTSDWYIYDNKINPFNVMSKVFAPNIANAEITTSRLMDFTSNGFKNRGSGATTNASGGNYIYMAFAENPFVTSTGVPATAR